MILRHGKPGLAAWPRIKAQDLGAWIEAFNQAGIVKRPPPNRTVSAARTCSVMVTSDLTRSIESGRALGLDLPVVTDSLFREAGLPYGPVGTVRMPAIVWAGIFRLAWFFGFHANSESFSAFRERSRRTAARLIALAREHGSVLFVGHGLMNTFIARHVLAGGWRGPRLPFTRFWAWAEYTRPRQNNLRA